MLSSIRKFSSSIFAKVFLIVVAIPFIFWGMGPLFTSGNINTIAKIGDEKISTQEFTDFIKYGDHDLNNVDKKYIESLFSSFIGEKLIEMEIKNLDINLPDESLGVIIKNEKLFKKNNKFSRTEYEKFLVNNSLNAIYYETHISKQERKKQLFDFIGGGILPSNFMVNNIYNKINQERDVELINLNESFTNNLNFTNDDIKSYYNANKENFTDIYKNIKFIELNPKNLTENNEFDDLFFKRIDEIDDFIVEGKKLNFIIKKFNLESSSEITFNSLGKEIVSENIDKSLEELIRVIINIELAEPTIMVENKNKYYVVELVKIENVEKKITDQSVINEIASNLKKQMRRKLTSELISKINNNVFKKSNFDNFSRDKNISIKKVKIKNLNDESVLKKDLVKQIYSFPEKKIVVVADISLSENFLIYIDKVKNISIDKNSEDYNKYYDLAKVSIINSLYNSYDMYLQDKYKIDVNYKTLDQVSNSFR